MRLLVDTNVWLERLLNQEKPAEVGLFLDTIPSDEIFVTDLALHSISLVMLKLRRGEALLRFIEDTFIDGAVTLVTVAPGEIRGVIRRLERYNLDFDDAYQSVAAERQGLTLISFDADFNRTERGRKTPAEILKG